MHQQFDEKFEQLPPYIKEWMAEESPHLNEEVAKEHNLSLEEVEKMKKIVVHTILGFFNLNDFLSHLKDSFPKLTEEEIKKLALDIVIKRFYPIRDYLKDVDGLIKNLGGSLPENKEFYKKEFEEKNPQIVVTQEEKKSSQGSQDIVYIGIGSLLNKQEIKDQFITSKKITVNDSGEEVGGTLNNWIADYKREKGEPPHSSLERQVYLSQAMNPKKLDNSERIILGEILKAYDQGTELPISKESSKIILSEVFHKGNLTQKIGFQNNKDENRVEKDNKPNSTIDLRNS
jgi:hypothetical protein